MTEGMVAWVVTARQIAVRGLGWLEAARDHFALPADVCSDRVPTDAAKAFPDHYHSTVVAAIAGILAVSRHISA